jgi:hypothetical protein
VNFVRFDPASGAITSWGYMHPDLIAAEQAQGQPILEIAEHILPREYRVDLSTHTLTKIS